VGSVEVREKALEVPEQVLRELTPQVLGAVVRRFHDFAAAEDAVQEALLAAAMQWPQDGFPDHPRGWLIQVASRRMMDYLRSEEARRRRDNPPGKRLRARKTVIVEAPGLSAVRGFEHPFAESRDVKDSSAHRAGGIEDICSCGRRHSVMRRPPRFPSIFAEADPAVIVRRMRVVMPHLLKLPNKAERLLKTQALIDWNRQGADKLLKTRNLRRKSFILLIANDLLGFAGSGHWIKGGILKGCRAGQDVLILSHVLPA
jgi:DNA-directed RNA polymerase specialized sigma24 family protein